MQPDRYLQCNNRARFAADCVAAQSANWFSMLVMILRKSDYCISTQSTGLSASSSRLFALT
jgi:hypothetical protein